MDENKKQHLEFIQNIITRLNANSFQIKGMAVTIVSAFLALYAAKSAICFIVCGVIPTVVFWLLDAYYLQQERKFRGLYDNVAGVENEFVITPYAMPIHIFLGKKYSFVSVLFSKTVFWFYGIIIAMLIVLCIICYAISGFSIQTTQ